MGKEDNFLCSLCLCPIWNQNIEEIGDNAKEILDVIFINRVSTMALTSVLNVTFNELGSFAEVAVEQKTIHMPTLFQKTSRLL